METAARKRVRMAGLALRSSTPERNDYVLTSCYMSKGAGGA